MTETVDSMVLREVRELRTVVLHLANLVSSGNPPKEILTRAEAMSFLRIKSPSAFYRWTAENEVPRCGRSTYRRSALIIGQQTAEARSQIKARK